MNKKQLWLNLSEWLVIEAAISAFTITEQYRWYISAGMLLLLLAVGLRWLRTRRLLTLTGLEIPLLLFLGSAGLATWIAVDRSTALLQFARMLGAVVLFYALIQSENPLRPWLSGGVVLLGVALAVYWPLQHSFSVDQAKFIWAARAGEWLTGWAPQIPGPSIHPNVAAGSLAPILPFAVALAVWADRSRVWLRILAIAAGLIIGLALLLTSSRGAWLGLGAAGLISGMAAVQTRWLKTPALRRIFWGGCAALGGISLLVLISSGALLSLVGQMPDPTGTFTSRVSLWRQGLLLIGDYPFTGSGLMGFRMVYAIYGILIHVPHHDHLHNTYLEVGLEQGLPGLIALLWGLAVVLWWAWRGVARGRGSPWGWAGLAALVVLAVHGFFDVVFYVTRTLPLVGALAGMAWMINEPIAKTAAPQKISAPVTRWASIAVLCAAVGLGILLYRPILSSFFANLGTVEQTRLELTVYDSAHFDNPTLDEIRQRLDLSRAQENYYRALYWQGHNRTALQRLTEIALSCGNYSQALRSMQVAWESGERDEITRLLYGDALAASGSLPQAAETVSGLPWAAMRLNGQAWYRYYRQADHLRAAHAWQTVLLLDPANADALSGLDLLEQP